VVEAVMDGRMPGSGWAAERGALSEPAVRPVHRVARDPDGLVDIDAVAAALTPCDLLESGDASGWSYLVPHHGVVLLDDGRRTRLLGEGVELADLGTDPFAAIELVCERYGLVPDVPTDPALPAFTGGLVGAFGYDLARRIERVPDLARRDREQPALHLRLAHTVVAIAPERDRVLLITRRSLADRDPGARIDDLLARLAAGAVVAAEVVPGPQQVRTNLPRDAYLEGVTTVLEHIAAGDCFQVNLTQRLTARWPGDTHALYRALRRQSHAAFGAALPSVGVASVSPETFLAIDGRTVTTRPVKGTRPRAAEPGLDAALADDLATSDKDRAENVMIVDLERNDLGRVCRPGTVRVPTLVEVEAHPTVWHLVSSVTGQLREGVGYGSVLRATFPCGSVTGAPKVAAMSIIERLEGVRRGWYCGAIGFLAPGHARLSVAIRTATLYPDGLVDHPAGGGIVADSDPTAELAESLDKAAAFLRAVSATSVTADGASHGPWAGSPGPAHSSGRM
jgi:para-aminobenzoate synthetase component I